MGADLNEEQIIRSIWKKVRYRGRDPFDDDASWVPSSPKKLLVAKCDMLVSFTDVPPSMSPAQIARKAVVSSVSDLAAKGARPSYCMVSVGLPKKLTNRAFVQGLAEGFREAEKEYRFKMIGGDTNATSKDLVIDVLLFGHADSVVPRSGARPGNLVAVSGDFGLQPSGLLLLLGKAVSDQRFKKRATDSVLEPKARTDLTSLVGSRFTSCIDSSDGLALSLYHLAESSGVDLLFNKVPVAKGVKEFAAKNNLAAEDLALFGGEEFELVCTLDPADEKLVRRYGMKVIGRVIKRTGRRSKPSVTLNSKVLPRKGWVHFSFRRD